VAKFNNSSFNELYETFSDMFKKEGDVYGSLLESITSDYKHHVIKGNMQKTVMLQILSIAAVDYFIKEIDILDEEHLIDEFKF